MAIKVAALFVEAGGVYSNLEGVDLFPGSGAVGRTWDHWQAQTRLAV